MSITEQCKVIKKRGNYAYIELERTDKCSGCNLCSFNRAKKMTAPAKMNIDCEAGDTVVVEMPENSPKAAPFVLYSIPLLLMLGGILAGLALNVYYQIGFAFGFLALGFLIIFIIDKIYRKKTGILPVIIQKISTPEEKND